MDVKFKVVTVSKNLVGLEVVPPTDDKGNQLLKASGSPTYGQCSLIVPEDELDQFEVGLEVDATFDVVEAEEAPAEEKA